MTVVLLVGWKKKRILPVLGVLFIGAWISRRWLLTFGFGQYLFSLIASIHIYKFCIGIVVAIVYDKLLDRVGKTPLKAFQKWMTFVTMQVVVIVMFMMSYRHWLAPLASIIMFISWLLMNHDLTKYSNSFIYRVCKWLGDISYSIYLVHSLVLYVMIQQFNVSHWWVLLSAGLVITVIISALMYRFVEKPSMDLAKRIVSSRMGQV